MLRFKIWHSRCYGRTLSRHCDETITVRVDGAIIGRFRNGREIRGV